MHSLADRWSNGLHRFARDKIQDGGGPSLQKAENLKKDFEGWGKSEPLYHAMDRIKYYYEEERDVSCATVHPSFLLKPPLPAAPPPRVSSLEEAAPDRAWWNRSLESLAPSQRSPAINYTARNAFFISPRYYRSRWLY